MKQQPYIGVVDCNNFFVSCERLFRPDLLRKPVVVLSSNDGCVVARSQEVKDMGIPMGVPYFQVKDSIKDNDISVFSSHFALYRDISRRVFEVLRTELDTVEQYSIDEAFFMLPPDGEPAEVAHRIKDKIEQQVGVPVSVGIGSSKTLAKTAVAVAKKGTGVHVWTAASWQEAATTMPLASVWGVGARLELRAKQHSLRTVGDWLAADTARITRLFGVVGARLQQELHGVSIDAVSQSQRQPKSIMSSRSFKHTTTDEAVVRDAVAYHVRHIATSLREQDVGTCELRVSIRPSRHSDFVLQGGSKSIVFPAATNDTLVLLKAAATLCDELFQPGVPYKKAGVVAVQLQAGPGSQQTLFSTPKESTNAALMAAIDTVNTKTGTETIQLGSRLRAGEWGAKIDARSPAYTTRWADLVTVRS